MLVNHNFFRVKGFLILVDAYFPSACSKVLLQVPYGCLVPPRVKNLLVAGRCCAGDMVSHCAMRNMMACTVTGQGAGVAAAVSLQVNF